MLGNNLDVRGIVLCKSFQAQRDIYEKMNDTLPKEKFMSLQQYVSLSDYDGIFSFKVRTGNNLLKEIKYNNKHISDCMCDSIFYKTLYVVYPKQDRDDEFAEKFWDSIEPFFFITIVHSKFCSADFNYREKYRQLLIDEIRQLKKQSDANQFKYKVYYSLDLSEYVILWKTKEPAHVLKIIQHLYKNSNLFGYTNTIYALPLEVLENDIKDIGRTNFALTVQAVANSYEDVSSLHKTIVDSMKKRYNEVSSETFFSLGNDDYLGVFPDVSPAAFVDLHKDFIKDLKLKGAVLSSNTVLAINAYSDEENDDFQSTLTENIDNVEEFLSAKKVKERLEQTCNQLKDEFIAVFNDNQTVFAKTSWKKPVLELLILLDNMSKSTVFDDTCFLFLDSAHLFLYYLKHLIAKYDSNELFYELTQQEENIETFVREWEQLANHVVQIDGILQRTPGYEAINYNISIGIVEYHNAFAQKIISYFAEIEKTELQINRVPRLASFVVPKMCRNFKTRQCFYDEQGKDSMLFVTIPNSQVYESNHTMMSLTHEISHYCPSCLRLRSVRTKRVILALAIWLCREIGVYCNDAIKQCYETLLSGYNKMVYSEFPTDERDYLYVTGLILKKTAFIYLNDNDFLNKLHGAYYRHMPDATDTEKITCAATMRQKVYYIIGNSFAMGEVMASSVYDAINNILTLFKEGYADLMMVYVLSLNQTEYLNGWFLEFDLIDEQDNRDIIANKMQRALVVYTTMTRNGVWNYSELKQWIAEHRDKLDGHQSVLYDLFIQMYENLSANYNEEAEYTSLLCYEILNVIIDYLSACYCSIKGVEEKNKNILKKRDEIKKSYRRMTGIDEGGLFSLDFQNILHESRKAILDRWDNRKKEPFSFGNVIN